jgi:membrane-associated phospholipid phosphatase
LLNRWLQVIVLVLATTGILRAQSGASASASSLKANAAANNDDSDQKYILQPGEDPDNQLVSPFLKHIVQDQKQFWTTPTRLKTKDLKWILPFSGITAAFIASDSWWSRQVNPAHEQTSLHISDYGTYSLIGLGGASFVFGHMTHNDHLRETGLLAGEAAINATGLAYGFKEIAQRQRPYQDDGNGHFFTGGGSFPSEHSAIAWSIASVWAHEYPGWFSEAAAYSLATAISATRVTAKQHFPSDVIVGGALGWVFGHEVYRAHHDPELGGSGWGSLTGESAGEHIRNPNYMASPYVELDSWIYPAMQRLIALGYLESPILGMRPWTRIQCARVLEDAQDKFADEGSEEGGAGRLYAKLTGEFSPELARLDGAANVGAGVDEIYTRSMDISGKPVTDGFNFGQTIINDYGRPYGEGYNNVTGIVADAEIGPVAFSLQGEYEHAPDVPSELPPVLNAISAANFTPPFPDGRGQADQFRLLNSAVFLNINNVEFSFGEQSQWLGPGQAGALLMSNNAPPFPTFKIDDVSPHRIPGLSRVLGPFRTEFFIGQLSGQRWEECDSCAQMNPGFPDVVGPNIAPQPFIHGEKISFQPTPNFEFGMGITAMFGGPGLPVTFGNFFRTYYVHSETAVNDPGKRISAADFTYRMNKWLTVYGDSLVVDEVSPIGSSRATVNPGFYMPQIPKIPKLELRAEGLNEPVTHEFYPGFVYYDLRRYRSGYTNDGDLLASWIGRMGRGAQAWLTYSFAPRTKFQFDYRLQEVNHDLLEGGRLVNYAAQCNFMLTAQTTIGARVQYEQWWFPLLASTRQDNVATSIELRFNPRWRLRR